MPPHLAIFFNWASLIRVILLSLGFVVVVVCFCCFCFVFLILWNLKMYHLGLLSFIIVVTWLEPFSSENLWPLVSYSFLKFCHWFLIGLSLFFLVLLLFGWALWAYLLILFIICPYVLEDNFKFLFQLLLRFLFWIVLIF